MAKLGAEYVLRLLPRGTHEWRRFITPTELAAHACHAGLQWNGVRGMQFEPITRRWTMGNDTAINYVAAMTR